MNQITKKIYFSIFLLILTLVTAVTTTYAWYSTNQTATIDDFSINVGGSSNIGTEDGIEISIDGINFSDSLDKIDCEKAILIQKGYEALDMTDDDVEEAFSNLTYDSVTPIDYTNLSDGFEKVTKVNSMSSSNYFSLDIYVSVSNTKYTTNNGLALYFGSDYMATSDDVTKDLLVDLPTHPTLGDLPTTGITMNPVNAMRMGVVVYEPVAKYDPEDSEQVTSSIYSFSSSTPSYTDGVYNFGGINTEYNTMLEYYNAIMSVNSNKLTIPDDIKDREDEMIYGKQIFSSSLGCTSDTMVKLRFYIWMEGWDSDCFNILLDTTTSFDINLTNDAI